MNYDSHALQTIAGQTYDQILPDAERTAEAFKLFYTVVARLRALDGCPWDLEQTPSSIRGNIIEEAYELAEAITEDDNSHIKEETGDLYLLATMVAYMSQQEGRYTVAEALHESTGKLIRRHPHVFGEAEVHSPDQVVQQWNEIKRASRGPPQEGFTARRKCIDTCRRSKRPTNFKKAAKVGFDWKNRQDIWQKIEEELVELGHAHTAFEEGSPDTKDALEEEFGDLLFTVVNAARLYGIEPSIALHRANEKFSRRFRHIEMRMKENHLALSPDHMEQMDAFWNEAKQKESP